MNIFYQFKTNLLKKEISKMLPNVLLIHNNTDII